MRRKCKEEKIKRNIKDRTNLILFLLFCFFTLSFTVGYAALNEKLNISGEANFRVEESIRITNVELFETTNMGLENYSSKYGKNSVILGVNLPNIDSSVTYKVEITNSGTVPMWIDSIVQETNNNTNIEYVPNGIGIRELINPGDVKEFNLTMKYKDNITLPSNTNLDTMLRFNFIKPVSTLAKGTNGAGTTTFFNSGPITKNQVETITFAPTLEVGDNAIGYWDASENKDGTVIAWYTDNDNNGLYELTIGGIGKVYAPASSDNLFLNFYKLKSINFSDTSSDGTVVNYFDTSNATTFYNFFKNCIALASVDVSQFDTSNAISLKSFFYNCASLTSIDVSNFNTKKTKSFEAMFLDCKNLKVIDLSNFDTSNVTTIRSLFENCYGVQSINLSSFNTIKVTDASKAFSNCQKLTELIVSNSFDTSNTKLFENMFFQCYLLSEFNLNNNKYSFDGFKITSAATNLRGMFSGCKALREINLSNFDTSNVKNMGKMFYDCQSITSLNLLNFNTSKVTNMAYMFSGCTSLLSLDMSNFNTSSVTTMEGMFQNLNKVKILNLSNFDTSKVTSMKSMFYNCTSLTNLDISNFNFDLVADSSNMFINVPSNTQIYVKDDKSKEFILNIRNDLTNIQVYENA